MTDYQPNSHYCFVCGLKNKSGLRARFQNDGPGRVKINIRICDQHQGYPGLAHGGIIAALMDEVLGRVMLSDDPDRLFMTAKMEIRYRKPVPLNTDILGRGWKLKDRGRAVMSEGELILPDGTVAITGTATLFAVPKPELASMMGERETGWQVYSDEEMAALPLEALPHE
jgi:acyl-coenzyme A thioesterase PaaI-like protein